MTIEDALHALAKLGVESLPPSRLRIFTNEHVSLTRTDPDTGEVHDALFWRIDGDIHVHPSRWDRFVEAMRRAGAEVR